jgi:hypothetical protein
VPPDADDLAQKVIPSMSFGLEIKSNFVLQNHALCVTAITLPSRQLIAIYIHDWMGAILAYE